MDTVTHKGALRVTHKGGGEGSPIRVPMNHIHTYKTHPLTTSRQGSTIGNGEWVKTAPKTASEGA